MNVAKFLEKLNISHSDYEYIVRKLKRKPNELELWLFSAMYSEHCGYRHSKKYLAKLPKKNSIFNSENAGGVKIGSHAILFKMESHNHPSAVEPYNGAATGIGGIIRDVLAMNARPIALLDSLKFGLPDSNKTKCLLEGVTDGIASYGNCIGVPTLAGECDFDEAYTDNPLVNVMALGIAKYDEIKTAKALPDKVILLLGSHTMKDGIGGASFASKDLEEEYEENRISIQIADPLMEKKLIEATLEIFSQNLAHSCQDCGAAGILSSTSEMAAQGDCGIELYLDKIPTAQKNMLPYEIMLSETQERMMFCVDAKNIKAIEKISEKYEIPFAVIGKTNKNKQYRLLMNDEILADIPAKLLSEAPFVYVKPKKYSGEKAFLKDESITSKKIENFVSNSSFANKKWIYSQYDSTVGARTVRGPKEKGASAIWIPEENSFIGISVESKPNQVNFNPYEGTLNTVMDAAGKLTASGFEPLGITNCLNFANPNDGETMYQFTESLKGMKKALNSLKIPVVSGNVSFYNKTENYLVYPTPVICMIGVSTNLENIIPDSFNLGETIILLGNQSKINYGGLYFGNITQTPHTDFSCEKKLTETLKNFNKANLLKACLRVTKGGIFGAVFKGCADKKLGFKFEDECTETELFSESQGRYLISVENPKEALKYLSSVPHKILGKVCEKDYKINNSLISSDKLYDIYNNSLSNNFINGHLSEIESPLLSP